jgi:Zn-dependent M28 family amino/carboxypeptidase
MQLKLEQIAQLLSESDPYATIEFVFFGAEERIDGDPDHHHYGSRARVAAMSTQERTDTAGMISVDMIGYGPAFHVRTMKRGPQTLSAELLSYATDRGIACTFRIDPGATGWSDHEAYELAGIPAAWVEWRDDPTYHTVGDTASHVRVDKVDTAGELVWGYVTGLDQARVEKLR